MTTTAEQIQELSAALDQDVSKVQQRICEAEENLLRAQEECEAAKNAGVEVLQQREGFRRAFAKVLGLTEEREALSITVASEAEPEASEAEPPRQYPQLVPPPVAKPSARTKTKPTTNNDIATMTLSAQVKHILGNQVMTLNEIRAELKARKLSMPNLSNILSTTKHKVLDADGRQRRDPKNGDPVKRNTFRSPSRGSWCVAESDDPSELPAVLTQTGVQAEMLSHQMGRPSSRAFPRALSTQHK